MALHAFAFPVGTVLRSNERQTWQSGTPVIDREFLAHGGRPSDLDLLWDYQKTAGISSISELGAKEIRKITRGGGG